MPTWLSIIVILVFGYVAIAAYLYFSQSRLIFLPHLGGRELVTTPAEIGLDYRDVWFEAKDGVRLHGWWVSVANPRGAVLFFHGNAGNVSHRLESIEIFANLGLNVLIIDYRGYGQSEGRITEEGTYLDARAALGYLDRNGWPREQVLVFGRSLGAAVAAWLGAREPVGGVVIESAFASVPDMAAKLYPWLPVRWLSRFHYDTEKAASRTSNPVLVVHSPEDEIIPFDQGRKVFAATKGKGVFLEIAGGHNEGFLVSGAVYTDGIDRFVTQILGPVKTVTTKKNSAD